MQCVRCQGPVVAEVFVDWNSDGGQLSFPGWRCVMCGDITDAMILAHRASRPNPLFSAARHYRYGTVVHEVAPRHWAQAT